MDQPDEPNQAMTPHLALVREWSAVPDESLAPERRAARRAAGSLREIIARLATSSASVEALEELADHLAIAAAVLPDGPSERGGGWEPSSDGIPGELERLVEQSPIVGRANAVAPPVRLEVHDDHIVGHVRFSQAYEGPVGKVHGGFIAAVFDELLGSTQLLSGRGGMTGRLTINFRSPPRLGVDLRLEGRVIGQERRKIFCEGTMWDGDRLCAEAEGLFVSLDPERYRQLTDAAEG